LEVITGLHFGLDKQSEIGESAAAKF
jgi:hypothetical protein